MPEVKTAITGAFGIGANRCCARRICPLRNDTTVINYGEAAGRAAGKNEVAGGPQ